MERSQGNVPYALKKQDGWIYNLGVDFIVKLGERGQGRRLAVLEYSTADDEWPGHSHPTEDEIFHIVKGALTFRCGKEEFEVEQGGFVFRPRGTGSQLLGWRARCLPLPRYPRGRRRR